MDLDNIAKQIRFNCDLSDAHYLFIEKNELSAPDLMSVAMNKLGRSEELEGDEFNKWLIDHLRHLATGVEKFSFEMQPGRIPASVIEIEGKMYDAFNMVDINKKLMKDNLFYAGIWLNNDSNETKGVKAGFLLAEIDYIDRTNGITGVILGKEHIRNMGFNLNGPRGQVVPTLYDTFYIRGEVAKQNIRKVYQIINDPNRESCVKFALKKEEPERIDELTTSFINQIAAHERGHIYFYEWGFPKPSEIVEQKIRGNVLFLISALNEMYADTIQEAGKKDYILR